MQPVFDFIELAQTRKAPFFLWYCADDAALAA